MRTCVIYGKLLALCITVTLFFKRKDKVRVTISCIPDLRVWHKQCYFILPKLQDPAYSIQSVLLLLLASPVYGTNSCRECWHDGVSAVQACGHSRSSKFSHPREPGFLETCHHPNQQSPTVPLQSVSWGWTQWWLPSRWTPLSHMVLVTT